MGCFCKAFTASSTGVGMASPVACSRQEPPAHEPAAPALQRSHVVNRASRAPGRRSASSDCKVDFAAARTCGEEAVPVSELRLRSGGDGRAPCLARARPRGANPLFAQTDVKKAPDRAISTGERSLKMIFLERFAGSREHSRRANHENEIPAECHSHCSRDTAAPAPGVLLPGLADQRSQQLGEREHHRIEQRFDEQQQRDVDRDRSRR